MRIALTIVNAQEEGGMVDWRGEKPEHEFRHFDGSYESKNGRPMLLSVKTEQHQSFREIACHVGEAFTSGQRSAAATLTGNPRERASGSRNAAAAPLGLIPYRGKANSTLRSYRHPPCYVRRWFACRVL